MVAVLYENAAEVLLMASLVLGSAFFSGSETAFFNLSGRQIRLFRSSGARVQRLVGALMEEPSRLLNCLLFGNMTVNVLYFAVASVLSVRIGAKHGFGASAAVAAASFLVLVLFGEMIPKSLAYANCRVVCLVAAVPMFFFVQLFRPLHGLFKVLLLEPVLRVLLGAVRRPRTFGINELRILIDTSRRRGHLTADENKLLTEVIELGFLKVRHVMRPRVDMVACNVTDPPETAVQLMQKNHLTKLPVYVRTVDNVVGVVYLRQILLRPGVSLDKLVQRVHFVPEQKTVVSLLEFFRQTGTDMAIVVDEYGGIAGFVRLEDIAEEIFGPLEREREIEPVEQLGPFKYRLAGDLAVHDWADAFGVDLSESRVSTLGGLVTALLGKIPQEGDSAYLGNLKFTVEKVDKNRIESLLLTFEPLQADDGQ